MIFWHLSSIAALLLHADDTLDYSKPSFSPCNHHFRTIQRNPSSAARGSEGRRPGMSDKGEQRAGRGGLVGCTEGVTRSNVHNFEATARAYFRPQPTHAQATRTLLAIFRLYYLSHGCHKSISTYNAIDWFHYFLKKNQFVLYASSLILRPIHYCLSTAGIFRYLGGCAKSSFMRFVAIKISGI